MKGKKIHTEETALSKLKAKRDVVVFQELKQIMIYRTAISPSKHVGNGTIGILDYLQNKCDYSVRYLKNDLNGAKTIKNFKKTISNYRYGAYASI